MVLTYQSIMKPRAKKETPPRGGRRPSDAIAGVVVRLCYFSLVDVKDYRGGPTKGF